MSALFRSLFAGALAWFAALSPALAQSTEAFEQNVFVFGGPLTSESFGHTFLFWRDHYEPNAFLGVGYQRFFYDYQGFGLGLEAGVGIRVGEAPSAEVWTGAVARFTRIEIGDFTVTPSLTAGFSLVSDTIGAETMRTARAGESAAFLFYLGPEIAVSSAAAPQWEAFTRVQHRSGGYGTVAHIDGSNALTAGLRYKF